MKFLKILLIFIAVIMAILFIGGMFLPNTYSVTRSRVINAPQNIVFNNVADFNNFLKWNPWTKMEPSAKVTITGTPAQPGHLWEWNGKETGNGKMQITSVNPYQSIDYKLTFIKPFESEAHNQFSFTPVLGGTKVIWTMDGKGNGIFEKWMFLNMDNMMDKDFTNGLNSLKELSEN